MILGKSMLPTFLQFNNPGGFVMILSFIAIYVASKMEVASKGEAALPHDTREVMAVSSRP